MDLMLKDRKSYRIKILVMGGWVALVSLLHYTTPVYLPFPHELYARLYYFSIFLGGFWYGLRGGLSVSVIVTLIYLPHVWMGWGESGVIFWDKLLEVVLFNLAGPTVGILSDMEHRQRARNQELQTLAAIGEAVASITHSIKNILNSLKGGSYMVKAGLAKNNLELVQEGWNVAQAGIDRISDLAMDMLDFTWEHTASVEPSSLNDVVAEVCWATVQTPEVQNMVDLTWDLDSAIPPIMINRKAIYNAVMNLISNAVDACMDHEYEPGNYPWVKVRTCLEADNARACIEVRDNGGGINNEIKKKIFTPFFSTKFNKGTGLGLAITMKIVREHGGTLTLDTIPGHGSTFTIKLPIIP